jgi:phage/plasmid primase-like uncharacterized protein
MEISEIKSLCHGRWDQVFQTMAPALNDALDSIHHVPKHVPCPVHGGKDGFRFFRDAVDTGGGICNTCGPRSDGIAMIAWVNGWTVGETLRELTSYLGGHKITAPAPRVQKSEKDVGAENERLNKKLIDIWKQSVQVHESIAEPARLYLARRGLPTAIFPSVRFNPSLPYYEGKQLKGNYPALVAMVENVNGQPVTLHRTYLSSDGTKARVDEPKKLMMYPSTRSMTGCAIRLANHSSILGLGEGIETTLSGMLAMGIPGWATINADLMESIVLPPEVTHVVIWGDKDISRRGEKAAKTLIQRLWAEGRVAVAFFPVDPVQTGQKSIDWNNVLIQKGIGAFPTYRQTQEIFARKLRAA